MDPTTAVALSPLMKLTDGDPDVLTAIVDGPVDVEHPDLAAADLVRVGPEVRCLVQRSASCGHGTAVAGVLVGHRSGISPGICPGVRLLVRPVFAERGAEPPTASAWELAAALFDVVDAGARVVNLSLVVAHPTPPQLRALEEALDLAAARDVLVVSAAGNQGTVGGSTLTRHAAVVPVAACGRPGEPISSTNLGASIARRGLLAPGEGVLGLSPGGGTTLISGTSIAAAFVTGAAALLRSLHPKATSAMVATALTGGPARRPRSVVPPMLNAWGAHQYLLMARRTGGAA